MDFATVEAQQGVRFLWNKLPASRIEQQKDVLPVSMFLTPFFNSLEIIPEIERQPLKCERCDWNACKLSIFDYGTMMFQCSNCKHQNKLSSQI
jgi:hypothetical protein